jgi:hypothetical protein
LAIQETLTISAIQEIPTICIADIARMACIANGLEGEKHGL